MLFIDPRWLIVLAPFLLLRWLTIKVARILGLCHILLFCSIASAGPFEECNAQRRHFGLPPFIPDPELMKLAQAKAEWQAARHVSGFVPVGRDGFRERRDRRGRPYNGHEGPRVPGAFEGTGCARNPGPFIACRALSNGSGIRAGCGMAIGSDGHRYMVVLTRRSSREGGRNVPVINTSHLTPDPIHVPYIGSIPADPSGWHVPTPYSFDNEIIPGGGTYTETTPKRCPRCGRIH